MNFRLNALLYTPLLIIALNAPIANAKICTDIFSVKENDFLNPMEQVLEAKEDFVVQHFIHTSYRENGCSPACAANLTNGIRIQHGLSRLSPEEQQNRIYKYFSPNFNPKASGYHGNPGTINGLDAGAMARLAYHLLSLDNLSQDYKIRAVHRYEQAPLITNKDNIDFVRKITAKDAFGVDSSSAKSLLVAILDRSKNPSENFLTAHYYSVVKYENGIVHLHDPKFKGRTYRFRAVPFVTGGFTTFELRPIDLDYNFNPSYPKDLLFMINGLLSIDRVP